MTTVLIADDEVAIGELVALYLAHEGFRVVHARDGREALFMARQEQPDLIIVDVMMPEMDGYTFLREHRKERDTPIIFLTARADESERIVGLALGADDFISKPFSPRELVARVRAVLRRWNHEEEKPSAVYRLGNLVLDTHSHRAFLDNHSLNLTPTEFDLLTIFMRMPGRAFSRGELLERLQGDITEGFERTIDVHIRNLRVKIEADTRHPRYVETVYGVGYRFNETAERGT